MNTTIWGREPVLWMAVIQAALAVAVGFGVDISTQQLGLLVALSAAVLGFVARSKVTPVATMGGSTSEAA